MTAPEKLGPQVRLCDCEHEHVASPRMGAWPCFLLWTWNAKMGGAQRRDEAAGHPGTVTSYQTPPRAPLCPEQFTHRELTLAPRVATATISALKTRKQCKEVQLLGQVARLVKRQGWDSHGDLGSREGAGNGDLPAPG